VKVQNLLENRSDFYGIAFNAPLSLSGKSHSDEKHFVRWIGKSNRSGCFRDQAMS